MNEYALLQKATTVDAHGGVVIAFGTDHFCSSFHGFLFLLELMLCHDGTQLLTSHPEACSVKCSIGREAVVAYLIQRFIYN
jgi:hypothetical protein